MAVTAFIGGGLRLEFFDDAISDTSTINCPANIIAGDLITLVDFAGSNVTPPADTIPSGFTKIETITLTETRQTMSYKIAVGGEGSLTGIAGLLGTAKALAVFRPSKPIVSVNAVASTGVITTGDPAAVVIGAASGTPVLVALAGYGLGFNPNPGIDPRSFTPAKDGEVSNLAGGTIFELHLAYKIMNRSSQLANIAIDMPSVTGVDASRRAALQGCYLELTA